MKISDLKIGDYFWAMYKDKLQVFGVLKNGIFVADNWEGDYDPDDLEFVELIKRPIVEPAKNI